MTDLALNKNIKAGKKAFRVKLRFSPGRDVPVYLLLLPAALILFVFSYLPIWGIVIAFQDYSPYKGFLASKWVGLEHFMEFLIDPVFWRVMKNTVVINIYSLIFGFPAPIIFALLLNEISRVKFKKAVQTISYLPYFVSWVVAAGIVVSVLSPTAGVVSIALKNVFGIEPTYYMTKTEYFRSILIISGIWKGIGMSAVYYIASITSIDPQLYEAAMIDGAGRWKQTWHITLPGLANIITVLFILQLGNLFSIGFEQIFLLYNPTVYEVGDVISTYTYRLGIEQTQFSATTAIGLTQSLVNFAMVFMANRLARKLAGWSLW